MISFKSGTEFSKSTVASDLRQRNLKLNSSIRFVVLTRRA